MHPPIAPAVDRDRRSVSRHRALALIVIALVMALTACAGGSGTIDPADVASLREQVTALTERDAARAQRLEELETTTDRLTRTNPVTRVTRAEREIAGLSDTLSVLDERLATAIAENEQRDTATADTVAELAEQNAALVEANEQLRGALGELRGQLDTALGRIDRVSGEIEDLEIRHLTLRDRLDRISP